jgi:hypothetical protein
MRTIQEEVGTVGNTWTEVETTAGNGIHWCCFAEALNSKMEKQKLT